MQNSGQFMSFNAAADLLTTGAIEINKYESEIYDMVRRSGPEMERMKSVPATGAPHRYFEETAINLGAFSDPRTIATSPGGPTRVERYATIKAITNQSNFGLFDVLVTKQQQQFAYVEAKDIEDIINGIQYIRCQAIWQGTDTSLTTPTTIQYVGLLTQITLQYTIAIGSSIIDGLKAQVATMVANTTYAVKPTAIYINPVLGDLLDREAKAANITLGTIEVVAGVKVKAISTQAGELPLIPTPFIPKKSDNSYGFAAPASGYNNYFAVIVSESDIERPFIDGNGQSGGAPMLYQLGLVGDLQKKYIGICFDCVIAKGASYSHSVVAVVRP